MSLQQPTHRLHVHGSLVFLWDRIYTIDGVYHMGVRHEEVREGHDDWDVEGVHCMHIIITEIAVIITHDIHIIIT